MKDKDRDTRVAALSPARRHLLERLLNAEGVGVPDTSVGTREHEIQATMVEILRCGRRTVQRPESNIGLLDEYKDKSLIRRGYGAYHSELRSAIFEQDSLFMNLGYVAVNEPQSSTVELPVHLVNRNFIQLVLEVIGDCDLKGRSILDIGCGRGGTISVMRTYFDIGSAVGLDLVADAVAFCNKQHRHPNTWFLQADAEELPFGDASFDVVTNIESSHHYPNITAFYREVARTLKSNGHFLYATLLPVEQFATDVDALTRLGLVLQRERDVTRNVLVSCDQCQGALFQGIESTGTDAGIANAIGLPGSQVYRYMQTGRTAYRLFRFQKPRTADHPTSPARSKTGAAATAGDR